jgi:alpha-glucuronidase
MSLPLAVGVSQRSLVCAKGSLLKGCTLSPIRKVAGPIGLAACLTLLPFVFMAPMANAETPSGPGDPAWLGYRLVRQAVVFGAKNRVPDAIVALGHDALEQSSIRELELGWRGMLNGAPRVLQSGAPDANNPAEHLVVLGTQEQVHAWRPALVDEAALGPDGYRLRHVGNILLVEGGDPRGVLYGTFALLNEIAEEHPLADLDERSQPSAPVRWTNEWDNSNGSIERGYGGSSIFFDQGTVRSNLSRAAAYARLLASVGINGCTINNVNSDPHLLLPGSLRGIARIANVFRPYGVRLSLAVDIASPKTIGGLDTFDPGNPRVVAWWRTKVDEIYALIPDFGGFVVKADSEGQPGPSHYGRSPADAANMLAAALEPHGGIVMYRAFVYNHHLDWRNPKADRARAAYDIFHPLDGQFARNVIVQIKNGPIDFQVREPVSPLFAALRKTNVAIELEIAQEYTGQQRQLVYLPSMWATYLNFDLHAGNQDTPLKNIVDGKVTHRQLGGFVGVANVGLDANWMGSSLALANLYGFGRLAWNPNTTPETIAKDWARLTFGNNQTVVSTISRMLLSSWHIYEDYTGPLGLQTLTNILGSHYGPDPQSQENNGWGQWIRADRKGVGMDRTVATGTGFIGQYPPQVARMYESLKTCPDNLLLFMHHVPYTYHLHTGKTVIQTIYNLHYSGAAQAADLVRQWQHLNGLIDEPTYQQTLKMLEYQAGAAIVWRDAITRWFEKMSGIPDDLGRVGHYPGRITASDMQLNGYTPVDVTPWEAASGGKAYVCKGHSFCTATAHFNRPAGQYIIAVQYFDYRTGTSTFRLILNQRTIGTWSADNTLPGEAPNGATSTRYTLRGVSLRPGDVLTIEGHPNGDEPAPIDYLAITSESGSEPEELPQ